MWMCFLCYHWVAEFLCQPDNTSPPSCFFLSVRMAQSFCVNTLRLRWDTVYTACAEVVTSSLFCVIFYTIAMWHGHMLATPQGHNHSDHSRRPVWHRSAVSMWEQKDFYTGCGDAEVFGINHPSPTLPAPREGAEYSPYKFHYLNTCNIGLTCIESDV